MFYFYIYDYCFCCFCFLIKISNCGKIFIHIHTHSYEYFWDTLVSDSFFVIPMLMFFSMYFVINDANIHLVINEIDVKIHIREREIWELSVSKKKATAGLSVFDKHCLHTNGHNLMTIIINGFDVFLLFVVLLWLLVFLDDFAV